MEQNSKNVGPWRTPSARLWTRAVGHTMKAARSWFMTMHLPRCGVFRRLGLALWLTTLAVALTACGGGGTSGIPAIQEFSADRVDYYVGEHAQLRVRFSGGSGRIEPNLGPVVDGATLDTGVIDASRRYRLVVETPGQPAAARDLQLTVSFRNRYQVFDAAPMAFHAAVATADGGAIVFGGSRGLGVLSDAIERFDPATRTLTRIGTLATGRSNHAAVSLGDGRVLVFGGSLALGPNVAELVDEHSGAVSPAGVMAQTRSRHAAVRLADGRVLAVGGVNRNTAELWDPTTRTWRLLGSRLAHAREYPSATLLADGKVLVVGGDDYRMGAYVFAEIFNPATERFTPVAGAPTERRFLHGAWRQADGSVLVAGGEGSAADGSQVGAWATVWRFDPVSAGFASLPALGEPRTVIAGVMTPDDELLLIGGQDSAWQVVDSGVSRRAAAQTALPTLPSARSWHTLTRLADGRVLVLGGSDEVRGVFAAGGAIYE